ncbi:unnamed protein product [Trifolium pratense]|uniref:Uncharacterized protein n=1 Tax=Trifolium pratense TaxID=57577 RepID=A0ACB0LG43_TRIPR|nr:unnamed protein product [Trifolium pratense]
MQKNSPDGGSGCRTVVVGVKMDSPSKELLTWALVKVAQPGDLVVALHVLGTNEIVNGDGKSSLLSLVKSFDSVLNVYEGFCNLKQVDLKLKICRGSSVKKILRDSLAASTPVADVQGLDRHHGNGLLGSIHWTLSKSTKVQNDDADEGTRRISDHSLAKVLLDSTENVKHHSCSICGALQDTSCHQSADEPSEGSERSSVDGGNENSMAIVSVQTIDTRQPEMKPGWPLLHRKILSETQLPDKPFMRHQTSVVQWAMKLPRRNLSYRVDHIQNQSVALDSESGALVPVDSEIGKTYSSPACNLKIIPKELEALHEKYSSTCRLFEYQELVSVTSNFLPENLIGKGGSSMVYRGCLRDGKELAVKILKPSYDVLKEFLLEIEIITTLHHKNIITLLGFCFENGNLLLVYDFLSRGSLEENIHGTKKNPGKFGWAQRYKVATGVAEALDYLHCKNDRPVIHRDVKSSNVLLSEDFEPQLSDFGLATWASTTSSYITCTDVAGTFGYMAPEYFMYGKVSDKIDVYAFGVVLLELLSGRKPISADFPKGQQNLVMWASPLLNSGKVSELLDPSLGDNYDHEEMERMVLAATLCIKHAPKARPQMSIVSKLLQGDIDAIKWAKVEVNTLEAHEMLDDEACPPSNLQSHLNLALLDVEDDSLSMYSVEQSVSLEDYLRGRWSRSSSFD